MKKVCETGVCYLAMLMVSRSFAGGGIEMGLPLPTLSRESKGVELNRIARFSAALMVTAGSLIATTGPSVAAESPTAHNVKQADIFFDSNGMSESVQQKLLSKIEDGQPTLAMTPGARAVSTKTESTTTENKTVLTYADGSVEVSKQEKPKPNMKDLPPEAIPLYVGQCRNSAAGSSYRIYYDCLVQSSKDQVSVAMRADYSIYQGSLPDRISNVFGGYSSTYLGQASVPRTYIVRSVENSNGPAHAVAEGTYTLGDNTRTYRMNFYVSGDTARSNISI